MNVGVMRLGFAVFWLLVASLLFLRRYVVPEAVLGRIDSGNLDLGAVLAVVLGGWNLVRWYMGRPRPPAESPLDTRRRPLEPRRDGERVEEYNPEFDFTRQPRANPEP
jgi:hypothetical protein